MVAETAAVAVTRDGWVLGESEEKRTKDEDLERVDSDDDV
jgi:hypothetical protein